MEMRSSLLLHKFCLLIVLSANMVLSLFFNFSNNQTLGKFMAITEY